MTGNFIRPIAVIVLASGLHGQMQSELDSCIASLDLPSLGLFAARARTSGEVAATVTIDQEGKASGVDLSGGERLLQAEVQAALDRSQFSKQCSGKKLKFVFAFTLLGPAVDTQMPPRIRFRPPNRFEITFRRVKANIETAPPTPATRK